MAIQRSSDAPSVWTIGPAAVALLVGAGLWLAAPSPYTGDAIFLVFLLIGGGAYAFASGFTEYQRYQLVIGTPTSKIRSMAMGMVEVEGTALPPQGRKLLRSPVTGSECLFYRYEVEEYQQNGDDKDWVTIDEGMEGIAFYVQDDTGYVLVDPRGADLRVDQDELVHVDGGEQPPEPIQAFIERNQRIDAEDTSFDIGGLSLATGNDRRYTEWIVAPDENVYVMGEAMERPQFDGSAQNERNIIISSDEDTPWFTISDSSEKELIDEMQTGLVLRFIGGGLGMLAGYAIILLSSGWF